MFQLVEKWNQQIKKWLWLIVIVGVVAAIPVAMQRMQTEKSANYVEIVFNYRNLVNTSLEMPKPDEYIDEQLGRLKEAGVHTMALFESNLSDLNAARRLLVYNSSEAAALQKKFPSLNENYTYLLFTSTENEQQLAPIIEKAFLRFGVKTHTWQFDGRNGLILETPVESAKMKPMQQDPIAIQKLIEKGYAILPRLSDSLDYDQEQMNELLQYYQSLGVKRILFDGDAVKGFNNDADMDSLAKFADLLNRYNIGIANIECLKEPQQGMNKLAYLTKYNTVRLHSINEQESFNDFDVLADRFLLATKDRNIRMIYLNAGVKKDMKKAEIVTSIDNLIDTLKAPGDAIVSIEKNGFTMGEAVPFQVVDASWQRITKLIAAVGGVALIAIMISYFVPPILLPAFVLGLIGSAGLYVLKPALFEQVLALAVAISGPTIAMVLAVRRVDISPSITGFKARFGKTIGLFLRTTVLSLLSIPFVIALLNNITYSLVLDQFRGVSLLHFVPIGLTALYIFLYRGGSVLKEANHWLKMPITVLWVFVLGVAGAVGMYYLSRTGNAGDVSSIERSFRSLLENTLGVRPRNKEFLIAHPLFLIAAFAAYRYRIAIYVFIAAAIGQLSMIDTFAHIHTPITISTIRTLLGLGLGLVIGIIGIFVWTIIERCWGAWCPKRQE